ncbi:MAG: ParM/StbA family protein [Chamaesiphon sp.]|nr:ParM/StbA family protein [Chamaesiphon sp.]
MSLAVCEFRANTNLTELKSNYAIERILAAIWVAAQECAIGNRFNLVLSCLLPPGELADSEALGRNLKEALLSFDSPSGKCRVALKSFICHPEGGGLAMHYLANRKDIGDRSVGVVMMGHRNLSCFKVLNGTPGSFRTSDLGFSTLVKDVQSNTSGYHERDITETVAQYLISKDIKVLDRLLLQKKVDLRADELERLIKAIELAKSAYCRSVIQWLEIQFPKIDEFVLGGGSASMFENEILKVIEPILTIVPKEKVKAFFPQGGWMYPSNHPLQPQLRDRFADVCALWSETFETDPNEKPNYNVSPPVLVHSLR